MVKRIALSTTFLSVAAIGISYTSAFLPGDPPSWAAWIMALSVPLLLAALMVLGLGRRGANTLFIPIGIVFLLVAGSFVLALTLPAENPNSPVLIGGLPQRAAIVMYGIGVLPLFILPLAYAFTFEQNTLSEDDLARLRAELKPSPNDVPEAEEVAL